LDPKKRLSAKDALNHKFFAEDKLTNPEEIIKQFIQ
jgi:hypothetical protein